MTDGTGLRHILEKVQPDEIYNLAAQSHVRVSFDQPEYTADVVATGTLRAARSVSRLRPTSPASRPVSIRPDRRKCSAPPRRRRTNRRRFIRAARMRVSKVAAHWYAVNYREAYGLFISNGILFNHESERRGETFVTRKITRALARIKLGLQKKLFLGNLDARRDWGYAADYVEAMWLMLQQTEPGDYVVATGESHSVREFLDVAAARCGLDWNKRRRNRSALFAPHRSGLPAGRFLAKRDEARLEAESQFRGTGAPDGGPRSGTGAPGADPGDGRAQGGGAGFLAWVRRMDKDSRIFVAGHRGLVGSAICRRLREDGYSQSDRARPAELDLRDRSRRWTRSSQRNSPEYVFLAAAKVGGILANSTYPAEFLRDNLAIQINVIDAAYRNGVKKLEFLGSSCIYPKLAPQPIKEEYLLTGPLEPTNEWYAIAKIAGIKLAQAYRQQYGFHAISLMPTNLYGPGDNFDLETSHVLPALMRKAHEARENERAGADGVGQRDAAPGVPARGRSGRGGRLSDAALRSPEIINVGVGTDVTIRELAEMVRRMTGFEPPGVRRIEARWHAAQTAGCVATDGSGMARPHWPGGGHCGNVPVVSSSDRSRDR